MHDIVNWFVAIENKIVTRYQVDPLIFIALELLTTPIYLYAWSRILRDVRTHQKFTLKWINILLIVILIPYLYILIWGRNIPWYIYLIFVLAVIFIAIRNYFRFRKFRVKNH